MNIRDVQAIIDRMKAEARAASETFNLPLRGELEAPRQGQGEPTAFSFSRGIIWGSGGGAPVAAPSLGPEPMRFSFARGLEGAPAASGAPSSPAASAPAVGGDQSFKVSKPDESYPQEHSLAGTDSLIQMWNADLNRELAKERG